MRKLLLFFFILILVIVGVVFVRNSVPRQTISHVQKLVSIATPTPTIGLPQIIAIPKLGVKTHIEAVGMDSAGRMDVPKVVADTAWFDLGVKPGEIGNAVIDGHFDTVTGAPSVFYYLKNLQKGDSIQVIDEKNQTYTFTVTTVTDYPTNTFPLVLVFGPATSRNLNLITCSGNWDKTRHNYSMRTVVFSRLISSTKK